MTISPPRPKGPPLNALRAFEAAARHGSFTLAASELCVTPGAIAQHVKTLETWSGAKLFKRQAHGIVLSTLGTTLLPQFTSVFDGLGAAVQALRSQAAPDQIRIAALPSVAQLWLSPRLPGIRAQHRDLGISVVATELPPNLKRELYDISIFFEDLPGNSSHIEVCRDYILPVCTPELARQLHEPADLEKLTCLHDTGWAKDWQYWLNSAIPGQQIDTGGPAYSLYSLMLEEARNGAGVMIGHLSLVRSYLQSGSLVAPFEMRVELNRRLAIATAIPLTPESMPAKIIASLIEQDPDC